MPHPSVEPSVGSVSSHPFVPPINEPWGRCCQIVAGRQCGLGEAAHLDVPSIYGYAHYLEHSPPPEPQHLPHPADKRPLNCPACVRGQT